MLNKNCVEEMPQKYQGNHDTIAKENLSTKKTERPELYYSKILAETEYMELQRIIGNIPSDALERALNIGKENNGIPDEYPKRGYIMNPMPIKLDIMYQRMDVMLIFGTQCSNF
eukprot:3604975-Ditylum_brightwellii.AAC.1